MSENIFNSHVRKRYVAEVVAIDVDRTVPGKALLRPRPGSRIWTWSARQTRVRWLDMSAFVLSPRMIDDLHCNGGPIRT